MFVVSRYIIRIARSNVSTNEVTHRVKVKVTGYQGHYDTMY